MNIPDKALEAVLAKYEGWPEAYTEERQELLRELVRADLEAAAPFIAAQALRDFASQVVHDDPDDDRWRWETSDVADAARAYARELDPS